MKTTKDRILEILDNDLKMSKETDSVEMPCVTISNDKEIMTVHNYVSLKGKIVLTKAEASLLMIELWKFINAT